VVKQLLVLGLHLGLYLLDAEVKENTEEGRSAGLEGGPKTNFSPRVSGYRSLGRFGVDKHFIHLNVDFSAKLMVRLIRIGC
jgi:hypothetical protein